MTTEDLLDKLEKDLNLPRLDVLLLLADTVAEGLLHTHSTLLNKAFLLQSNRLVLRRLKNVLDTLQKLNFLRFYN